MQGNKIILPNIDNEIYPLSGNKTFNTPYEYVLHTLKCNNDYLDKPLHNSANRKIWLKNTIFLTEESLPHTFNYVEQEELNKDAIYSELKGINTFLPKNQCVFHGGKYPLNKEPERGDSFKLLPIFSSTLDVFTARLHYAQGKDHCFWILKTKNENIRIFVVDKDEGGNSGYEYEVIILDEPEVKVTRIDEVENKEGLGLIKLIYFEFV